MLKREKPKKGGSNHLNLFNNRQQPKKKRKSRTAFTNHQIFELEKRFLYQKYLSPADRDEIAAHLGLSNAQVITWFQNRRAKLKRDMEELKKDVESTKLLKAHKSFMENVQDLGILKKKPEDARSMAAAAAAAAAAAGSAAGGVVMMLPSPAASTASSSSASSASGSPSASSSPSIASPHMAEK
ncbi:hypothetical protein J437_LFUL004254 [Ladona fulva]|uniref:Homeobox domain-containing protein n=1 Tax=Ladona fulva TaxID=123851 RepID=A0A8K0K3Q7_LADFU|nr:hypothetical protein J437_LFUL004254 [Ladona fulva]